jgi:predicted phosphoribosyltransferase
VVAYRDRTEAGHRLGAALVDAGIGPDDRPIVLGVARGGVPVAAAVAAECGGTVDVVVARKLGAPLNPELAIGAVAADGEPLIDRSLVRRLGVNEAYLRDEAARQQKEVARRIAEYRGGRPAPDVEDRVTIVVDDGVATGSTLIAVLRWVRRLGPRRLICAVPVGPPDTVQRLAAECDEMVCPMQPWAFSAVGMWYDDFSQVSDSEVRRALQSE